MILPIVQFYENSCIVKLFIVHLNGLFCMPSVYEEKDYWSTNKAYDTFKSYLLDYLK